MKHYITVKTSQPGRMAPNTALCFAITGAALLILGKVRRTRQGLMVVGLLGSITAALGVVSFFGYFSGVETAYGWGNLTRMAVHTAAGFIALGMGIFAFAWFEGMPEDSWIPDWIAFPTGIGMATVALTEWQALHAQLGAEHSSLPVFVLITGLMMTVFLVITIQLAQISWRQAKDVERVNWKLENEIIERKQKDEALKESESFFSQMFEQSTTSTCLYNPDGTIKKVNNKFCKMFGVEEKVIIKAGYNVFKDQATIDAGVIPLLRDIFHEKKTKNWETIFDIDVASASTRTPTSRAGKIFLEVFGYPVLNRNDNLEYVVLQHYDITKRKRAEEALRESEAFLKTLINAIPAPIFYKDREGKYLGCNSAFETFSGETNERLIGKSVFDINPPELAEIYQSQDDELFNGGGVQRYESQWKDAHGKLRDFFFNKAVFTDSKGAVTGLIGVLIDITERKRAEKALKESESRLKKAQSVAKLGNWEYDISTGKSGVLSRHFVSMVLREPRLICLWTGLKHVSLTHQG